MSASPVGVLLMTYGSAVVAEDVPAYLQSVYGGRTPDPEVVAEFERRYRLVGSSPLIRITLAQGDALQDLLDADHGEGAFRVEVGMMHSEPGIDGAVERLASAGVRRLVGIVLSPQFSAVIMGGYGRALDAAVGRHAPDAEVTLAGPWHRTASFLDMLADRVREALARYDASRPAPPVIFTAHSLPKAVIDRDVAYLDQLHETIAGVAERVGLPGSRWQFAYQSAGHSPEEWLKPDLKDLLPGLSADGHSSVLVVPVQFLSDHLEILYDIDVAARQEAEEAGLRFDRIELPNTMPGFIKALADLVAAELGRRGASSRATAETT